MEVQTSQKSDCSIVFPYFQNDMIQQIIGYEDFPLVP
jgi:hypothetical protein